MIVEIVKIKKIVYGGQGLADMIDGRKVFVWNGLPGEVVKVQVIKERPSYYEAIAIEIIKPSPLRRIPKDDNFLSTSPWQILDLLTETKLKVELVNELLTHHSIEVKSPTVINGDDKDWNYRNKMEYSFWGDDDGLHLALYKRDSHIKEKVLGSALAMPSIDESAQNIVDQLNQMGVRASSLKSLIIRANQEGQTMASLFVKDNFNQSFILNKPIVGIEVFYSNPRSPASLATKLINHQGDLFLKDVLNNHQSFLYSSRSFFQINVPVYRLVLEKMKNYLSSNEIVDLYSGVGSIGLSIAKESVSLIDNDQVNLDFANKNALNLGLQVQIYCQSAETIRDDILSKTIVIDPPRSGIHSRLLDLIRNKSPEMIGYLSCNPITQIRDLKLLNDIYRVEDLSLYNFFPHTPHIESLAILRKR